MPTPLTETRIEEMKTAGECNFLRKEICGRIVCLNEGIQLLAEYPTSPNHQQQRDVIRLLQHFTDDLTLLLKHLDDRWPA